MTTIISEEQARADEVVARAMAAFEVTIEALDEAVARLRAELRSGEKTVMSDLKAMNAAFLFAMQQQEKARDAGAKGTLRGGCGALDLEAARTEIGLRLACLREAGGCGGIPGRAE